VHVLSVLDRGKCRRTCSSLFSLSLYGRPLAATHLVTPEVSESLGDKVEKNEMGWACDTYG